jgi:hypothetical protein
MHRGERKCLSNNNFSGQGEHRVRVFENTVIRGMAVLGAALLCLAIGTPTWTQ